MTSASIVDSLFWQQGRQKCWDLHLSRTVGWGNLGNLFQIIAAKNCTLKPIEENSRCKQTLLQELLWPVTLNFAHPVGSAANCHT